MFENRVNNSSIYNKIYDNIIPFAIYFPQFHKIKENDKNYYDNFSDINNLSLYFDENLNNPENLETPLLSLYNLSSLSEYNLENINITNKQVDIAKSYGIKGFAIYYYWFTINSITNENPIMERGYANFFKDTFTDFKVFFVWANEDWSNNPAFNTNDKIYNVYDEHSFSKNADNLLTYFKHDNYYKIDNKPVFMLHHPWLIDDTQIKLFNTILNKKCIENNFDGVILIINSMVKKYDNFNNYSFHPNYKNPPIGSSYKLNSKNVIDYEKYIKNINFNENNINSLFFDFNNAARLYKPNKMDLSTKVIKNSDENIKNYIVKLKKSYSYNNPSDKINNILLINAWNEWGEKMHIEPSEEKQFYYLELIKQLVIRYQ